jgi:2-desacetyl-2-hydroxyethyl bacteriochlorophyllide A dehydrogenase
MRSLVCSEPGALVMEERPKPIRAANEVLIRIRRVGICGTDMHIFNGRQPFLSYPRVMGHEFAGEVEEAPEESGFEPGDRVAVMPYLSCGHCVACAGGKTNCCVNLEVLGVHRDGALADYVSVPAHFVMRVDGLTLDEAAMIEFLAIGAHAVRRAEVHADARVLVVGTGPIGLAAALFSKLRGGCVTVVDGRADRLEFARQSIGVEHSVLLSEETPGRLSELTNGEYFDVVFDATGNAKAMEAGFRYVAHGGKYALISVVTADITFSDPEFHKRETTLLACRNATQGDFDIVVAAMRAGQVPTGAFASHRTTLDEMASTLPSWMEPESHVIKALVEV